MIKFKTTKKEIMNGYWKVISVGYCELQHLLKYETPVAYTCGKDGWHADIYDNGTIAIVMGYAPFGEIEPSYELCQKYEKKARKITDGKNDYNLVEQQNKLRLLISDFVEECLELEK